MNMNLHAKTALRPSLRPLPLLLSLGLAACGSDYAVTPHITGQVIGSYYENAQVCVESSTSKLTCDSGSAAVRTAADGSYTLDGQGAVLVSIGTDAIRHETIGDAGSKVYWAMVFSLIRQP